MFAGSTPARAITLRAAFDNTSPSVKFNLQINSVSPVNDCRIVSLSFLS
ncbi:MAG: hypothetical protein HQK97_11820 [Nitrospirae bacterium]|nr:hypothetical protein [Nitrospirota bacterium]